MNRKTSFLSGYFLMNLAFALFVVLVGIKVFS